MLLDQCFLGGQAGGRAGGGAGEVQGHHRGAGAHLRRDVWLLNICHSSDIERCLATNICHSSDIESSFAFALEM